MNGYSPFRPALVPSEVAMISEVALRYDENRYLQGESALDELHRCFHHAKTSFVKKTYLRANCFNFEVFKCVINNRKQLLECKPRDFRLR